MIEYMDNAMLATQAALGARKLYGHDHAVARRHVDKAFEALRSLLSQRTSVKLVRLGDSLLFEDTPLPSNARLKDGLIKLFDDQGIEWVEFAHGLNSDHLTRLLSQLERAVSVYSPMGSSKIKVGRLARAQSATPAPVILAPEPVVVPENHVLELKQIWERLHNTRNLDHRLSDLVESVRRAVPAAAAVWKQMAQVKDHDEYTFVHTVNVSILSAALAESIGMSADQVCDVTFAALLHDVGKQHTPAQILKKPERLSETERKQMERHTVDGAAILLSRPNVPDFAPIVAFEHHANLDGTGYPNLGRNKRPHLASQIVHIADIFDALRTNRPYRAAMDLSKVQEILVNCGGVAFDRVLLDVFLQGVVQVSEPEAEKAPQTDQAKAA
jgi:putative nucleotidyltransferase with HDIG domain